MLIEREYERNNRGGILERETVEIKCDRCGQLWKIKYASRKRRLLSYDLCSGCRCDSNLSGIENRKENHQKVSLVCSHCHKEYKKIPSLIYGTASFCSRNCHHDFDIKQRYGHLESVFVAHPDYVAYLVGIILGDGHIVKKDQKRTSTIIVAFDCSKKWSKLLVLFREALGVLQIRWTESKIRKNCKTINFILPDCLLNKYGILYCGKKFNVQPYPIEIVVHNANYAAGLLNSDGQFVSCKDKEASYSYRFCNTVESITDSLSKCLDFYRIKHSQTHVDGRLDKRTGKINKPQFNIYVGKDGVNKLHSLCCFQMKGNIGTI